MTFETPYSLEMNGVCAPVMSDWPGVALATDAMDDVRAKTTAFNALIHVWSQPIRYAAALQRIQTDAAVALPHREMVAYHSGWFACPEEGVYEPTLLLWSIVGYVNGGSIPIYRGIALDHATGHVHVYGGVAYDDASGPVYVVGSTLDPTSPQPQLRIPWYRLQRLCTMDFLPRPADKSSAVQAVLPILRTWLVVCLEQLPPHERASAAGRHQ